MSVYLPKPDAPRECPECEHPRMAHQSNGCHATVHLYDWQSGKLSCTYLCACLEDRNKLKLWAMEQARSVPAELGTVTHVGAWVGD